MQPKPRKLWWFLAVTAYWLVLAPLLLFFPILQVWDASPEPFDSTRAGLLLLGLVTVLVVASWWRRRVHLALVVGLLAVGGFLFARNQGLLKEPVDEADRLIILRTAELLRERPSWDRAEQRACEAESSTFTLYCALRQASIDVTGGFRHRRSALQIVREQIELQRPDRAYSHRLGGYNADPQASFSDLHSLLTASLEEVETRLERR